MKYCIIFSMLIFIFLPNSAAFGCDCDTISVTLPKNFKYSVADSLIDLKTVAFIKESSENSKTLIGWCLSIIGGSIFAFINSSYIKPITKKLKKIYLIFIPGWICILSSLYYALKVELCYTGAVLVSNPLRLSKLYCYANYYIDEQFFYFKFGLLICILWLILLLIFWIFSKQENFNDKN